MCTKQAALGIQALLNLTISTALYSEYKVKNVTVYINM